MASATALDVAPRAGITVWLCATQESGALRAQAVTKSLLDPFAMFDETLAGDIMPNGVSPLHCIFTKRSSHIQKPVTNR